MAAAAESFLDSLTDEQRAHAQWPFDRTEERETWFFTPTDHGGLPLSLMTPAQHKRAHILLSTGLSEGGYNATAVIMGWENVLDRLEGFIRDWGRERGRDTGLFYWRIFGDPSGSDPWSWRVGGHHISINYVIVDGIPVGGTPLFLGADPSSAPLLDGERLRPLGPVERGARAIVQALSPGQLAAALVTAHPPTDIVSANRREYGKPPGDVPLPLKDLWRGRLPDPWHDLTLDIQQANDEAAGVDEASTEAIRLSDAPRGLSCQEMDEGQRAMVRSLLDAYASRMPEAFAEIERRKYTSEGLDAHWFCWAGSLVEGERYYYRIQGPDLLVECDNTQRSGNHVHTVWRDPRRDFGRDPIREHRRTHHT